MSREKLIKILDLHGIQYEIISDRVIALDWYIPGTDIVGYIDVSDFTKKDLVEWLGY